MTGDVEVIVTRPGAKVVLAVDRRTNKLLFFTTTFIKRIEPGRYTDPEDIVEIFRLLASRGHETKSYIENPEVIYRVLLQILESDLPYEDKVREVYKYLRAQRL